MIDFRNIRVLPLDEGAAQGPVTVEGDGEHTVEFRSTDVAGNEEESSRVTFTIGEAETTAAGDDARARLRRSRARADHTGRRDAVGHRPGRDGRRQPPETHDVNALPSTWDPNTLEVATGDVVRWNFPEATAGAPHDVYLIEPGEAPDSAGHE